MQVDLYNGLKWLLLLRFVSKHQSHRFSENYTKRY